MANLLLPSPLRWQPIAQTAAVLLLGQGFGSARDFLPVAGQLVIDLTTIPPFSAMASFGRDEGRLTVIADAGVGTDVGLLPPDPAAPQTLRLAAGGAALDAALAALSLPFLPGDDPAGLAPRASAYWSRTARAGPATRLVVILRRTLAGAAVDAELYDLPVVAVDAARPNAHLVVARALAQLLGGLADEFTRPGPNWDMPPDDWFTDPVNPNLPHDPYRLGRNVLLLDTGQRARLGLDSVADIVPELDPVWIDRKFAGPTPYRADPGGAVVADADSATIRVVAGGGGFRRGVVRCDSPCLLGQVPGPERDTGAIGNPIGQPKIGFCPVCIALAYQATGLPASTESAKRRGIDRQLAEYESAAWRGPAPTRVTVNPAGVPAQSVSGVTDRGATWKADIAVDRMSGLVIRNLKLAARPGDPMAASEDVAESITFPGIAYDIGNGRQELDVADALDNPDHPPDLEVRTGTAGRARLGVRLRLRWQPRDGLTVHAAMSLVCRTIHNDFDPGGAAEACKFFPQLTLSWSRDSRAIPAVRRLFGVVDIVANNRLAPGGPHLHGMVPDQQTVMLLTDSNWSKYDFDYVPNPLLLISLVWRSGRLMGNLDTPRATGALAYWLIGPSQPLLPEWSWLFDYGRLVQTRVPELAEVVVWPASDAERGARLRRLTTDWPPQPDPALGGTPREKVVKLPRQGAYDNVHLNADMGRDTAGRPMIAAPFCADVCLHLHVRWGIHAAAGAEEPLPFLGWSTGPHAQSNCALGAPLVPPNQKVTLGVTRPDAAHTRIRYVVEVVAPRRDRQQVLLEQGLGFAFTYNGLTKNVRRLLALVYADPASPLVADGFVDGIDASIREFFRIIYQRIRFYSYGYAPGTPAPQQIPVDVTVGPPPSGPPLQPLVDL